MPDEIPYAPVTPDSTESALIPGASIVVPGASFYAASNTIDTGVAPAFLGIALGMAVSGQFIQPGTVVTAIVDPGEGLGVEISLATEDESFGTDITFTPPIAETGGIAPEEDSDDPATDEIPVGGDGEAPPPSAPQSTPSVRYDIEQDLSEEQADQALANLLATATGRAVLRAASYAALRALQGLGTGDGPTFAGLTLTGGLTGTGSFLYGTNLAADDTRQIYFNADRSALVGGRLNNNVTGGELAASCWDPAHISQYALTWGWSQVSLGLNVSSSEGAKTKGSAQIGYNCANSTQFAANFCIANCSVGPAALIGGSFNISGSTLRSPAAVPVTWHDNWATGPAAQIKVNGDRTTEFPADEYVFLRFFVATGDGTLTTRTSNTAGVLTLESGVASTDFDVGQTITVKWNGGTNGRTLVISASSVTGTTYTVTASVGGGDVLPAQGTRLWISKSTGGTPRTFKAKVASSSHSAGVTTITLDRQMAATMDVGRTGYFTPTVMNVHAVNAEGGSNLVAGEGNFAYGQDGLVTGLSNTVSSTSHYVRVSGSANTITASHTDVSGQSNTVSGAHSQVSGAYHTVAATHSQVSGLAHVIAAGANYSLVSGYYHTVNAAALYSNISGSNHIVSAPNCLVSGDLHTVNSGASYSAVSGRRHTVSNLYTTVIGFRALTRRHGEWLHAAGSLNNTGDFQHGFSLYAVKTTNATQTDAYIDFSETVPSARFNLTTGASALMDLDIHASGDGTGAAASPFKLASYTIRGRLLRTSSGGAYAWHGDAAATLLSIPVRITSITGNGTTATIVTDGEHMAATGDTITISGTTDYDGTHTITRTDRNTFTISHASTATKTSGAAVWVCPWTVAISYVSGSGLRVQVTGQASTSIHWLARCRYVELTKA